MPKIQFKVIHIKVPRPLPDGSCDPDCPIYGLDNEWLCPYIRFSKRLLKYVPGKPCPWDTRKLKRRNNA